MLMPVSPKAGLRPHPSNWKDRPERANTHCFYCGEPVPNHSKGCVCLTRTVVLELRIRFVASVPADWDEEMIRFHRNDSSYCSSNDIEQIYKESTKEENICTMCSRSETLFVREATAEDHESLHYTPSEDD